MSACSVSQWGTQPIKPEFVDSGITAYLWMLQEKKKRRIRDQIVVYCELLHFKMLKTTATKSDSDLNCLFSSCSAFLLFKQAWNIHLDRLLPDRLQTFSKLTWFPVKDCFQNVHVISPTVICYLHMTFDTFMLERDCTELQSGTIHRAIWWL